jgi:hypothetical protein
VNTANYINIDYHQSQNSPITANLDQQQQSSSSSNMRQNVINELIQTERSYLKSLKLVVDVI